MAVLSIRLSDEQDRLLRQIERSTKKGRSELVREVIEKHLHDLERQRLLDRFVEELNARTPEQIAEEKAIHADLDGSEIDNYAVAAPPPRLKNSIKKARRKK